MLHKKQITEYLAILFTYLLFTHSLWALDDCSGDVDDLSVTRLQPIALFLLLFKHKCEQIKTMPRIL